MSDAYTVFWTRERRHALRTQGNVGKPLSLLFGGPHTSEPSFVRATVRPGDYLYPISVQHGTLFVLGRVRVRRLLALEAFVDARPDLFAEHLREPPEWTRQASAGLTPHYVQALEAFDRLRLAMPEMRYLAPTCTGEAVECEDGLPIRLDCAVPSDLLERLRYRSLRRERDLSKYIRDGRLTGILGVQGIYRLAEPSARELDALLAASRVGESGAMSA
jgi:hypothetical protein